MPLWPLVLNVHHCFPLVKNPNLKAILYRSLLVFHREHQFNNSFGQSYYFVTTAIPLHKSFTTFEGEIQSKKWVVPLRLISIWFYLVLRYANNSPTQLASVVFNETIEGDPPPLKLEVAKKSAI
jgi:hypothetical protein